MKIRALIVALVVAAVGWLGAGVASASTYARTGVSQAPYCHYSLAVSTGLKGSRQFTITAAYSECDLMLLDDVFSPNQCFSTFDVETAVTSLAHCTGFEQNRKSDSVRGVVKCVPGHRYKVDTWMTAHHKDPAGTRWWPQVRGSAATLNVVCGGKTWP